MIARPPFDPDAYSKPSQSGKNHQPRGMAAGTMIINFQGFDNHCQMFGKGNDRSA
ncbi:MAG: hypothetical protein ACXIUB_08980 [Wenzhouxiangella sp.]